MPGWRGAKCRTGMYDTACKATSLRASSPIWASETSLKRTRERAAKPRGAEERSPFLGPSLARSREARFACPIRRACSQATKLLITCTLYESSTPRPTYRRFMQQFFHNFDELIHEWRKSCTTVQEGKGRETLL